MQRKNIETLKANLLTHLDDDCNVLNVEGALAAVIDLIDHPTTQDELEQTRLGKYVNEFRKKTSHVELSKKAKELLKKYQSIVNQTTGTNNLRKKIVSQTPNGVHLHSTASPVLPNFSKVADDKSQLNGKVKNAASSKCPPSSHFPGSSEDKHSQSLSNAHFAISSSSARSQPNKSLLGGGMLPTNFAGVKKHVYSPQVLPKSATVAQSIPKNLSVMNGSVSQSSSNLHKNTCDKVLATNKKRHLDVPSTNSDNRNAKRARVDNPQCNVESSVTKSKVSNGIGYDRETESKVFSCKVSSDDLKCTIRSEPVKPVSVTSPALSIKSNSSSLIKQDLIKSDHVVNKPRNSKVETTQQLIQKLRMNGELCLMPSPTIYKITNNQIVKESSEDTTVVPVEAKPRSHKKRNKLQPPVNTTDLTEIKIELVQKFLRTSVSSNHNLDLDLPETKHLGESKVDHSKDFVPMDVSKLDPNSEEYRKELLKNPWLFLPPLPDEEIICDHEREPLPERILEPSSGDVNRRLTDHWQGINGQYDFKNEWKSWTQTYSIKTSPNSFLHILPYVDLD